MTALCKENGIELVLIKAPSVYPFWYDEYDAQIEDYANRNGLKFINFLDNVEEIGIDYTQDTYDSGLHLNLYGATKLSKYFAKILQEDFDLTDYRNDEAVNSIYQERLNEYHEETGL